MFWYLSDADGYLDLHKAISISIQERDKFVVVAKFDLEDIGIILKKLNNWEEANNFLEWIMERVRK